MFTSIPYPDIDPILFQLPAITLFDVTIGPFPLRWYALSYIVGIGLGYAYTIALVRNAKLYAGRVPFASTVLDDFVTWLVLGVILGGRIGYVLFYNLPFYADNPLNALMIWQGGMSFHGGLIGVVIAFLLYGRMTGTDPVRLSDLVGASVGICIVSVRIANFINGELYGRVTDLPWGMVFPNGGPDPRHPSQLYQAALEGLAMFLLVRVGTHRFGLLARRGAITGLFLVLYGLFRIVGEFFRQPDAQIGFLVLGLTMGMILSAPLIGFGLVFLRWGQSWPKPPPERG